MKKTVSVTQATLTVLYVSALLIANIITAKQMVLPFGLTMTCAIFIFPITYILSDVFSEVYGYKWSRFTCYLAFAMNLVMVLFFQLAISTEAPAYWTDQAAFETVLGNTPRILAASLLAYVLGDLANDKVFRRMKQRRKGTEGFAARAILSSFVGEMVDSAIFIPLAFLGQMPTETMLIMAATQVCLKVGYEIVIVPITTAVAKKLSRLEGVTANG